jgi:hypothetical protein
MISSSKTPKVLPQKDLVKLFLSRFIFTVLLFRTPVYVPELGSFNLRQSGFLLRKKEGLTCSK